MRTCASNPVKTKLFPSSYTGKLETARTNIRDAMEAISLTNAAVGQQAKDAISDLSGEFQELEAQLHAARKENEALVARSTTLRYHPQRARPAHCSVVVDTHKAQTFFDLMEFTSSSPARKD